LEATVTVLREEKEKLKQEPVDADSNKAKEK
jgi:hypothetical protein